MLSTEGRAIEPATLQRLREEAECLVHTKGEQITRQRAKKNTKRHYQVEPDSLHIRVLISPYIHGKVGYITKRSRQIIAELTKRVIEAIQPPEDGWLVCSVGRQPQDNEEFFFAYVPMSASAHILSFDTTGGDSGQPEVKPETSEDSFETAYSYDSSIDYRGTYHSTAYSAFQTRSNSADCQYANMGSANGQYANMGSADSQYANTGSVEIDSSYQELVIVNPLNRDSTRGTMTKVPPMSDRVQY